MHDYRTILQMIEFQMNVKDDYLHIAQILAEALDQSQDGKGHERHAHSVDGEGDVPFSEQPIMVLGKTFGIGFDLGQAAKKLHEAMHLPAERARKEILGAIVYAAAAAVLIEDTDATVADDIIDDIMNDGPIAIAHMSHAHRLAYMNQPDERRRDEYLEMWWSFKEAEGA